MLYVKHNIVSRILSLFILVISSQTVLPQKNPDIRFNCIATENFIIEKGLSQNTVRTIIQDKKGFLWFGTWDGLNKYDAYKFIIYNKENGLSNTGIHCLYEDKNGVIWIGTENGLNKLMRSSQKIIQYFHDPGNPNSITNNKIHSIVEDNNGKLWIGTERGLNQFDPVSEKFTPYLHKPQDNSSLRSNRITNLYFDNQESLWIGTYYGLIKFDISTQMLSRFYNRPEDSLSLSNNLIRTIFQDRSGVLWIGTEEGLNKFDYKTQQFTTFTNDINNINSLSNNKVYALYEDNEELLWIGTYGGGVDIFNKKNNTFSHYKHSADNINSLSNNKVYCIYEDKNANIWIGTYSGVNKVDRSSSKFRHFTHIPRKDNCLSSKIVWSFYEDITGVVWIATNNGINLYNKQSGEFSLIKKEEYQQNSLSSNNIKTIFKDKEGIYWIGTEDAGIDRLDVKNWEFENFQHLPNNKNSLCDNSIWIIFEDSKGYMWIGTDNGLSKYDSKNHKFTNFRHDPLDSNTICGNTVYDVYEDTDGKLFFCTKNGLCTYNKDLDNFFTHSFKKDNDKIIKDLRIMSMYKDKEGIFWFGTMGEGLLKYDPNKQVSKFYTKKHGLPNNIIYAALEDDSSKLWLSTNWGLSKFNKKTESFNNYDIEDGIQSYEFNGGAAYKSPTGEMFFGGMNGFNSFFPDEIKPIENIQTLVITALKIFNKETNMEYFDGDTIRLPYNDNFFSFEFSALDYINPLKNKYQYILENVDKDWVKTDASQRYAEYKNTKAGTYTFKVKASNNDKVWNDEGISLTVVIIPPWWNTILFKILLALVIGFSILFSINQRFRALKKKHEKEKNVLAIKQQLMDLERKSLRLQMNPHFIFNSLNSIQSFVVSNNSEKAIHYLAKFSKLMRMILQNSRETYIALSEELKSLTYYMDMEKLRFDNKFDYDIDVDPNIDADFTGIPPMIIQPYIENSIIHGLINKKGKGMININFQLMDTSILCTIQDNGIGREMAMKIRDESGLKRKSRGMQITKERLDILSKQSNEQFLVNICDLKNDSGEAEGTRIELVIYFKEL